MFPHFLTTAAFSSPHSFLDSKKRESKAKNEITTQKTWCSNGTLPNSAGVLTSSRLSFVSLLFLPFKVDWLLVTK